MTTKSFLARLVSLKEEDFLTTLLEQAFNTNSLFRSSYLKELGFRRCQHFKAEAHRSYGLNQEDEPDLTITSPYAFILQENKIDAPEGKGQLRRYARRVAANNKKSKLLVYLARSPLSQLNGSSYGVRIKFLRWERVARMLAKTMHKSWIAEEAYRLLEDYEMVPYQAITPKLLQKSWKTFEPQRQSLMKMLQEVTENFASVLDQKKYICRFSDEPDGMGVNVFRTQGRLKKQLRDRYIWVCCGVGLYDDEVTAYAGIGWVKSRSDLMPPKLRAYLGKHQFLLCDDTWEEYYASRRLDGIIGSAKSYDVQLQKLSEWMLTRTRRALKALALMEKGIALPVSR